MPPAGTASGMQKELGHCSDGETPVRITCIDYSPEQFQVQEVTDAADFLAHHRPSWSCVRWINVDGLKQTETYMSVVSNRMNQIMQVLTVIGTIFIPLTFLAGVYGMNMPIPENQWAWSYPVFWMVCLTVAVAMLYWFRRRGWL